MSFKRLSKADLAKLRKDGLLAKDLTAPTIKNLKAAPEGTRYAISDTQVPGLKVRVTDQGKKTFVLWRRMHPTDKSATARSIGEVGVIGLAEARDVARAWIALIKAGKDPAVVKAARDAAEAREKAAAARKADATIRKAWDRYSDFIDHQRQADKVRQIFDADILHWLGDTPVHELTRQQVKDRIRSIASRSVHQAYAAFGNLRTFLNWCRDEGDYGLESVPTDGMRAQKVVGKPRKHRKRVLTDDELFAFWRATRPERWRAVRAKAWGLSRPDRKAVALGCRTLLLTAARVNEIFESDRRELNPEETVLTVPPERFKSDESHMIQLSVMAQEIISLLPRWNAGTFLFSDNGEKPATVWTKDKQRIDRRMELTLRAIARVRGRNPKEATLPPYILHDLRRTVRTRLSQLKVEHEVREMILGHGKKGLDRVYDQWEFQTECREALEQWAALLTQIVTRPVTGDVIEIAKAREGQIRSKKNRSAAK